MAVERKDLKMIMPTGSGMTLDWEVEVMLDNSYVLVVVPLKAKQIEQAARLEQKGITAIYINEDKNDA
jgi:superfamily II DNA helicase RecQ